MYLRKCFVKTGTTIDTNADDIPWLVITITVEINFPFITLLLMPDAVIFLEDVGITLSEKQM